MFVQNRLELDARTVKHIKSLTPKFGYNGFGEVVFYRSYSRTKQDGGQESWNDVVLRVTTGTFSIRKDFYLKNHIMWDEDYWQAYAYGFAEAMFQMKWLPPGRGLWAMGSEFVYERGAMALYNCAYTNLNSGAAFIDDICWLMDTLMHGVGVGFSPIRDDLQLGQPLLGSYTYVIPDTREGWVNAVRRLLASYVHCTHWPEFDFSQIRQAGEPIKGFGGVSSGPQPLKDLLEQIQGHCEEFHDNNMDVVEFKTNIANLVGCCVVAGNVRRSAEISCGSIHDAVFMNLKNYNLNPHREAYGWMSNNSVVLNETGDFDKLGEIAERVIHNGEPGIINGKNLRYGRIRKKDQAIRDAAIGFNPCGEIPLEHREVCNLSETLPTVCDGSDDWYKACEYATHYCSTVSLLPTHQLSTNRVVARNRRIGVGIIDFSGWKHRSGVHQVTKWLRNGYQVVSETNRQLNAEAGVPEAIRKTTVKPGGTTPKLAGRTSGCGHPTFHHTLRRVRVACNAPITPLLVQAGVPYEFDMYSANTYCFEFPILQGPAKPAADVSLWEQAMTVVLLQREWADNAVSNTLYFRPMWKLEEVSVKLDTLHRYVGEQMTRILLERNQKVYIVPGTLRITYTLNPFEVKVYTYDPTHEEDDIEPVLSSIIPLVKSISLLPHTTAGVYKQMVEEGITEEEYRKRLSAIGPIDWTKFHGSDGMDERYCSGDTCEIPNLGNANDLHVGSFQPGS